MKPGVTIEADVAMDLRTVAAATALSEVYEIRRRDGKPISRSQEIDLLRNAIVGALVVLWGHAEKHLGHDNTLEVTSKSIDALVGLEGFAQAISRQWLDELDGRVVLPGYREKNFLVATKKRTVKPQPHRSLGSPLDGYSASHDGYSTISDYIPQAYVPTGPSPELNGGNHLNGEKFSETEKGSSPMLEVGLTNIVGNGDKREKKEGGVGGEGRGREGEKPTLLPSSSSRRSSKTHARNRCELPPDFALTPVMREYAQSRLPQCDVEAMFEAFRAHHEAHGKVMKNWSAAWRTWVATSIRFGYPKLETSKGRNGLPTLNG